jgi:hypothetical protein
MEMEMAMLQNRLLWVVIALVGAAFAWNVSVTHLPSVTARAQEPHHYPFSNGDTVSLGFIPDGVVTCVVAEVRGNFLKCVPAKETFTFNQPKLETWYNLATVKYIDRAVGTR